MPILRQTVSNAMMNILLVQKSSFALVLPTQHLRFVKGVRNCVRSNIFFIKMTTHAIENLSAYISQTPVLPSLNAMSHGDIHIRCIPR